MDSKSYSKGICWIDDCRIPFVDENDIPNDMDKTHLQSDRMFLEREGYKPFLYQQNTQGRFPANILVSDDMLNDGVISKSIRSKRGIQGRGYNPGIDWVRGTDDTNTVRGHDDEGTNSRYYDIDKWFDKLLDV